MKLQILFIFLITTRIIVAAAQYDECDCERSSINIRPNRDISISVPYQKEEIVAEEECDDGIGPEKFNASNSCLHSQCGDGFIQKEEIVEKCSNTCSHPNCGDGPIQGDGFVHTGIEVFDSTSTPPPPPSQILLLQEKFKREEEEKKIEEEKAKQLNLDLFIFTLICVTIGVLYFHCRNQLTAYFYFWIVPLFVQSPKYVLAELLAANQQQKEDEEEVKKKKAALLQYHRAQIRTAAQQQQRQRQRSDNVNHPSSSCAICLDAPPTRPNATPCGHVFCEQCILSWLAQNRHCPTCRKKVSNAPNAVHPIFFD